MISFCIITDGKEPEKLRAQMDSIRALEVPRFEIVVAGNVWTECGADVVVPMPVAAKQGRLGAMRNGACTCASGEILTVTDDDMVFHPDWFSGLQEYGWNFDVLSCRVLNPDGSRYWDWKWHRDGLNGLLDYSETCADVSLTGGLTIMKDYVFRRVQWDDRLGFNQAEDVDFTRKVKKAMFKIAFNPHSTITHNGPYTQVGSGVARIKDKT